MKGGRRGDRLLRAYFGCANAAVAIPGDRILDRMASGSNPPRITGKQARHLLSCGNAKWNFLMLSQRCTFLKKGKKRPFALSVPQFSTL